MPKLKLPTPSRGSVLVFSLIVLSFLLVAALSVATVTVSEKKISSTAGKSSLSFQTADSGVEAVLQKIYRGNYANLYALASDLHSGASSAECASGNASATPPTPATITFDVGQGVSTVSFFTGTNGNDGYATCGDSTGTTGTDWREKVNKIKSEGTYANSTRAVEVAVAAVKDYYCVEYNASQNVVASGIFPSSQSGSFIKTSDVICTDGSDNNAVVAPTSGSATCKCEPFG